MSNRYSHNRHDGNKGFAKTEKRFVPKSTPNPIARETLPNPKLSSSLRQSFSNQSDSHVASVGGDASASTSGVQAGETGDLVPGRIQRGNFVIYLPQDEAVAAGLGANDGGLDTVESQRIVDHLNGELSRLLKLNSRDFWREVASDASLHDFLDSYLKFRGRWYDFPYRGAKGIVAGVIVGEFELSRRVFMVLYRISSNRDPGARAADSLSPKDHAVLLQEKKLLDLPKLLDMCAIYGHENEDLIRSLVVNAIKAQPRIHDEFTTAISHFLDIVHTMCQRCTASLEVLLSSHGSENDGSSHLHSDYLEVMDFLNDAIVSMDAFVSAYKPAAVFFSCRVEMRGCTRSYGNEDLLNTLARLHDMLLPSLQRGFRVITAREDAVQEKLGDKLSNVALSLKMLSKRIVDFAWKLLDICYLACEVFEDSFPLPSVAKVYPANVEDPHVRADILLQTFREISEGYLDVQEGQKRGTFLLSVEKQPKIMHRIQTLQSAGWIAMDDEQFHYISGLMRHPLEVSIKETPHAGAPSGNSNLQMDEDIAIIESEISQIKDLFPDYGKGFLFACLEAYNHNLEEVIQRILDETLHADLQSLDTSLDTIPPSRSASIGQKDKGKGKLVEWSDATSTKTVPIMGKSRTEGPSFSSASSAGRFIRKGTTDFPDSDTLNSKDGKDLAKTVALASQLEYEDEYDDSFDDLGLSIVDSGYEEAESLGEKLHSNHGKSLETESGGPALGASSKWNSRKKPQFFVKDGKNYSYRVEGSVAVANQKEAALVNQAQKELIHGLGQGGNLPLGAVKKLIEANEDEQDDEVDVSEVGGGRGSPGNYRGRGRRGGRSHFRRDRAMKKHLSGVTGH